MEIGSFVRETDLLLGTLGYGMGPSGVLSSGVPHDSLD